MPCCQRSGLHFDGGPSPEDNKVPSLAACRQAIDAAYNAPLNPSSTAYLLYSLSKRVDIDKAKLSSSCSDSSVVVDRAEKVVLMLLGVNRFISMFPLSTCSAPASAPAPAPAPAAAAAAALPVQQLSSENLSQLAWSLSVLVDFEQRVMSTDARQLCYALAERAAQPGVMKARADMACRNWAGVLEGLANSGIKCSEDSRVQRAFTAAIEQQLPSLHLAKQKCVAQDLSMTIVACKNAGFEGYMQPLISAVASRVGDPSMGGVGGGIMSRANPQAWASLLNACGHLEKRGAGKGLGEGMGIITHEGAAAMARATRGPEHMQPNAQTLANMLWGLSHFRWNELRLIGVLVGAFMERISSSVSQEISNVLVAMARFERFNLRVVSTLAAEMVKPEHISSSEPQTLANVLWALASLGWYEPLVYDQLLAALQVSSEFVPQGLSNAMYSCAVTSHDSSSLDVLAQLIRNQDVSKQGGWNDQGVANTLYAWTMLSAQGLVSNGLDGMAQHLFREVNARGPAAFRSPLQLRQLHLAHLEAEQAGLAGGGLSTANGMQQAAAEQHAKYQANLQRKAKLSGGTAAEHQAVAALRAAGCEAEVAGMTGGNYYVNLVVGHEAAPNGIAVDILAAADVLRHPSGQLNGKIRLQHAQIRRRCDGLVVLTEYEIARHPVVVELKVRQELAEAVARREAGHVKQ